MLVPVVRSSPTRRTDGSFWQDKRLIGRPTCGAKRPVMLHCRHTRFSRPPTPPNVGSVFTSSASSASFSSPSTSPCTPSGRADPDRIDQMVALGIGCVGVDKDAQATIPLTSITALRSLQRFSTGRFVRDPSNGSVEPRIVAGTQVEQAKKCRNLFAVDRRRGELCVVDRLIEPGAISPVSCPAPVSHVPVAHPQSLDRGCLGSRHLLRGTGTSIDLPNSSRVFATSLRKSALRLRPAS